MADPRLVNYIRSQLSKGPIEQIKQILISRGWRDYQIEPAIELAMQQRSPQASNSKQQINSNVGGFMQEINSNTVQPSQSYQQPVEESSNLWILLVLGIALITGGVLALITLTVRAIII